MSQLPLHQELLDGLRNYTTQLNSVKQQLSFLDRQRSILQVTASEVSSYPTDKVWRSCGKAFILQDKQRFLDDLKEQERNTVEQEKNLTIKQNYLQTSLEKATDKLKSIAGN